jgi:Domain of unknown function (DUF6250)
MDTSDHRALNDEWQRVDDSTLLSPSLELYKQKGHWEQIVLFPNKDQDYAIEVELTLLHGETIDKQVYKEAGVVLRYAGENQFYYAGLGGFGSRTFIGKASPHQNNRIWSCLDSQGKKEEIKLNRPYKLRVECRGSTISLTEDNKNRFTVDIDDYPSSSFGFRTVHTQAQFANIVKSAPSAPKIFVIMPFTISLNFVYRTIREVITEKKFHCQRVDDLSRSTDIVEDIKKWLAKADLVIADLTNANPNVYYEVGYADALNKKLILLAQTGTVLGFNISHIRTLFYDDPDDLQQKLGVAIDQTI